MREAEWTDPEGRSWRTLIPSDVPDGHAPYGVVLYPVDLSPLGLPLDIEVRLHQELFALGISTEQEAMRRIPDIINALRNVLRVDAKRIADLYRVD